MKMGTMKHKRAPQYNQSSVSMPKLSQGNFHPPEEDKKINNIHKTPFLTERKYVMQLLYSFKKVSYYHQLIIDSKEQI